ncbi:MAG TPA: patatin-like phospholipase family protein [Hyphomicrobiaceae bacterium]|jgi:NTE family protein|nr:patatin-like phospholipase family protein [Hyphomicrobiaceae bacterium]
MTSNCKIGLALGGGSARGWAHIGVLRALNEAGIHPDIVVGTSIGAVVGGCYVSGHLDALESFACDLTRRKVLGFLDFNFQGSGLITGQRLGGVLEHALKDVLIEKLPKRYVAVATEIGTGHEVWLSRGSIVEAMRASYALPGIFKPIDIGGRWLFDGALVNPIPVSVCRALGARYVIAVNVNSDSCGRGTVVPHMEALTPPSEEEELADEGVLARNGRAVKKLLRRQFFGRADNGPGISRVMMEAINIVQDRIARSRLAGDPPDVIISPRLPAFGLFDFHRARAMIECGRAAVDREIDDITREISARREHGLDPLLARTA